MQVAGLIEMASKLYHRMTPVHLVESSITLIHCSFFTLQQLTDREFSSGGGTGRRSAEEFIVATPEVDASDNVGLNDGTDARV